MGELVADEGVAGFVEGEDGFGGGGFGVARDAEDGRLVRVGDGGVKL